MCNEPKGVAIVKDADTTLVSKELIVDHSEEGVLEESEKESSEGLYLQTTSPLSCNKSDEIFCSITT